MMYERCLVYTNNTEDPGRRGVYNSIYPSGSIGLAFVLQWDVDEAKALGDSRMKGLARDAVDIDTIQGVVGLLDISFHSGGKYYWYMEELEMAWLAMAELTRSRPPICRGIPGIDA